MKNHEIHENVPQTLYFFTEPSTLPATSYQLPATSYQSNRMLSYTMRWAVTLADVYCTIILYHTIILYYNILYDYIILYYIIIYYMTS